jgi:prevent-host-death family protein
MMLKEVGSYDAKTKLPEILRRVEAGESFTITNRGKPIADLIPSRAADKRRAELAISNILNTRKHKISDSFLAELKETGRK